MPRSSSWRAALNAPIVHSLRGKEHVEYDNPFDVGMTGLIGFASGYAAMKDCDTLLLLGTRLPLPPVLSRGRHGRAGRHPRRRAWATAAIWRWASWAMSARRWRRCCPSSRRRPTRKFLDAARAHYAKAREDLDKLAEGKPGGKIIHPQYVARLLSELAGDDAIFTCDVGTQTVWAARYLKMNGKRRLIGSFNHGSMANALLQAIGAQATFPGAAGRLDVGRRRLLDDDGRLHQPLPARPAGEGDRAEQRHAGLRRDGDEGERLPRCRLRAQEPRLRRHGRGDGHQGHARRGAAASSKARCARRWRTTARRWSTW